jgi:cytochrome P450
MVQRHSGPLGDRTRTSSLGLRNVQAMLGHPLEHLQFLAEQHGDFVTMPMLSEDWLLLTHPEDVEALFVTHHASLQRDEFAVHLRRVLGQGLLTSDGELWKRQRRLASSAFTPKRIRGYASAMASVTDRGLRRLEPGTVVRLHEVMSRRMMEVVAEVLCGAGSEGDVRTVSSALAVMNGLLANSVEAALRLPLWVPTPKHVAARRHLTSLDALVHRFIDDRRRQGVENRDALLSALLSAVDDDGTRMSDTQLRDETITLFLAGLETTSIALSHAFYLLGKNPDVLERVQTEVDAVLGGRLPTEADMPKLSLTERVFKEAMRLYPPAWVTGREVAQPITIAGRAIPVGTQVIVSQWLVHRDPRWWPRPEAFDPDRFLPGVAKTRPRFAYFRSAAALACASAATSRCSRPCSCSRSSRAASRSSSCRSSSCGSPLRSRCSPRRGFACASSRAPAPTHHRRVPPKTGTVLRSCTNRDGPA